MPQSDLIPKNMGCASSADVTINGYTTKAVCTTTDLGCDCTLHCTAIRAPADPLLAHKLQAPGDVCAANATGPLLELQPDLLTDLGGVSPACKRGVVRKPLHVGECQPHGLFITLNALDHLALQCPGRCKMVAGLKRDSSRLCLEELDLGQHELSHLERHAVEQRSEQSITNFTNEAAPHSCPGRYAHSPGAAHQKV